MRHLLDIMSSTVGQSVQRELRAIGIWEEGQGPARTNFRSSSVRELVQACEELIF